MSARLLILLLSWIFATSSVLAADADAKAPQKKDGEERLSYLAIIDGEEIPIGEYVSALRRGMQQRFYHGTIPEEEQKKFYKDQIPLKRFGTPEDVTYPVLFLATRQAAYITGSVLAVTGGL